MAETLVSPGVLARENDQSFITQQPVVVGAAIVGPTVKGPVEIPTVVTSYSDYQNRFGTTFESGSDEYSFLTSISAYNYFQNGGESLLVARVVSGSSNWAYAEAEIPNSTTVTGAEFATGSFDLAAALTANEEVRLTASSTLYRFIAADAPIPSDDEDGKLYYFAKGATAADSATNFSASFASNINFIDVSIDSSTTLIFSSSVEGTTYNGTTVATGSASSFSTQTTLAGGDAGVGTDVAFTLEAIDQGIIFNNSGSTNEIPSGNGALYSGSKDNIRWEVTSTSTTNGTFDLLIRRGDDNNNSKTVLETWSGLSLDPKADNYVARVIGDYKYEYDSVENYVKVTGDYPNASRYVRVKSVDAKTPNYFDNAGNAKTAYANYLPTVGSGSYSGTFDNGVGSLINAQTPNNMFGNISTQTQGLDASDYTDMLNLLANQDDYQFNVLTTPGLLRSKHASATTTALNNVQSRGDAIYVIDPSIYGSSITGVDSPVEEAGTINSSYGAMYWPWLQTSDPDTGDNVWVPASAMIPGVYAFNDNASEPWFAPAGINRGGLATVIRPERKLSSTNRDTLYTAKVNPIASFPGVGTVVYGQKTLQKQASALDRVNVRRLLIELKGYISQVSQTLVFEQNTAATRNNFLAQVNPYLESVQQRQGLYAFKVVMDESNNTPDVVDRNQLVGQIFLQPTKTAEFILLDFNVLPTGATFPA